MYNPNHVLRNLLFLLILIFLNSADYSMVRDEPSCYFSDEFKSYMIFNEGSYWVYNCVGINEIKTGNVLLRVYPNPTKSSFEIRCSKFGIQNTTIEIFDVMGNKIKEIKINRGQEKVEVDVKGWEKGLCLIKVGNEKNYYGISKIIIK